MWYVDLPIKNGEWENLGQFPTKEEAVRFIVKTVTSLCDSEGRISLISEVVEEGEE